MKKILVFLWYYKTPHLVSFVYKWHQKTNLLFDFLLIYSSLIRIVLFKISLVFEILYKRNHIGTAIQNVRGIL